MRSRRWTDELLDALRYVGDPAIDSRAGEIAPIHSGSVGQPAVTEEERAAARRERRPPSDTLPGAVTTVLEDGGPGDEDLVDTFWTRDYGGRSSLDPQDTALAQDLFRRFGQEISAMLLLAALPQSYAVEPGAHILMQSAQLHDDLVDRIFRTTQFLIDVMTEHPPDREPADRKLNPFAGGTNPNYAMLAGGRGYVAARWTRLAHARVRADLGPRQPRSPTGLPTGTVDDHRVVGEPIHQEHMLGMYLTFCVGVWESLEQLGIRWTAKEKDAYFQHWDWIAHLMGIGHEQAIRTELTALAQHPDDRKKCHGLPLPDEVEPLLAGFQGDVLRPRSVEEAEDLLAMIRDRTWPSLRDSRAFSNSAGKRLVRALLAELEEAMPAGMRWFPSEVMRFLADERVKQALGLGDSYLPPQLFDWVQGASRRWSGPGPNLIFSPGARVAANQVSLHSVVKWSKDSKVEIHFVDDGRVQQTSVKSHNEEKRALASIVEQRTAT